MVVSGCFSQAGPTASRGDATGNASTSKKSMVADFKPDHTFHVGGDPDWMAVADDAVWVSISSDNEVVQLKANENVIGFTALVPDPCSGLVAAFGSLWVPSCGEHILVRVDLNTGKVLATIPVAPADSEGGITAGAGSIWMTSKPSGILSRIDPKTNTVISSIEIPSGSYCAIFASGFVWVTSTEHSVVSQVDPSTNKVVKEIPVGKNPRFLTASEDSVWTLNQGDGTISRIDSSSARVVATIPAGLAGHGGEIAFGFGSVWVTLMQFPITRIDAHTNTIISQWTGAGGDSIRAGLGSVWLTHLKAGKVWRVSPDKL